MDAENKPKYYTPKHAIYSTKWDKANCHYVNLKYVNWQYDKIVEGATKYDLPATQFVRMAVAEKLASMGIDIYDKGEKKSD